MLPPSSLLIIHESYVRPHLEYGDIVYDKPNNSSLSNKIKSLNFNTALAIADTIRDSTKEKFYQELSFESLKDRRCMRKIVYFERISDVNHIRK